MRVHDVRRGSGWLEMHGWMCAASTKSSRYSSPQAPRYQQTGNSLVRRCPFPSSAGREMICSGKKSKEISLYNFCRKKNIGCSGAWDRTMVFSALVASPNVFSDCQAPPSTTMDYNSVCGGADDYQFFARQLDQVPARLGRPLIHARGWSSRTSFRPALIVPTVRSCVSGVDC